MRLTTGAAFSLAFVWANQAAAQTVRITVRVVDAENRPVREARIRFIGVGTPVRAEPAEFSYEVPATLSGVDVELLAPQGATIRYPPNRRLGILREGEVHTVVVGPPIELVALEASLDSIAEVERALAANGERIGDLKSMLQEMRPILDRLQVGESELAKMMEQRRVRYELYSEASELLDTYVLHARDFVDGLARLAPLAVRDEGALLGLRNLALQYNETFTKLNASRESLVARIAAGWSKPQADLIRFYWSIVMSIAIDRIHRGLVLPLSPHFESVQSAFNLGELDEVRLQASREEFRAASLRLAPEIDALKESIDQFRRSMERQ